METRHSSKGYDIIGSGNSSRTSDHGDGLLIKALGTTVAGAAVGGPLFVGMGITLALTVSLGVIGIPLMLIFSPLLIIPCFILGTAIAGFSVAALLALAGISTLNSVFPHHSYSFAQKTTGWKQEHPRQETIEDDQESRVPPSSIVSAAAPADKDAGQGEEEEEEEEEESNVTVTKEKEEEEEEEEAGENETTAAPSSQTPPDQPDSATSTVADTSQKKQPSQKSKKQNPKK